MKRHKMRYLQTGHIPAKADTEKQKEWVKTKLDPAIKEAQEGKCQLLFMDAAHFILQPFICALWCVTRLFVKASAGRNRINVLGVVNAITKEIFTFSNTSYISAETIVDFLKQLKKHYGDIPLKIVLDNARYQHCKLVEAVAKQLNIDLLFLPSYSPNLNIIERLWKFTKKKVLYAKYYESPIKFHTAINGFFQTVNQKYTVDLKSLLTLKFQFFENKPAEIFQLSFATFGYKQFAKWSEEGIWFFTRMKDNAVYEVMEILYDKTRAKNAKGVRKEEYILLSYKDDQKNKCCRYAE